MFQSDRHVGSPLTTDSGLICRSKVIKIPPFELCIICMKSECLLMCLFQPPDKICHSLCHSLTRTRHFYKDFSLRYGSLGVILRSPCEIMVLLGCLVIRTARMSLDGVIGGTPDGWMGRWMDGWMVILRSLHIHRAVKTFHGCL